MKRALLGPLLAGACLAAPMAVPSTMRDGAGRAVDLATGTRLYIHEDEVRYGLGFLGVVDARGDWLGAVNLPDDPYASLRDAYLARREREVADIVETPTESNSERTGEPTGG